MTEDAVRDPEPMLVRFDSYEGGIAEGELKTLIHPSPFGFHSLDQLLLIMDDLLDALDFPRETGALRSLRSRYRALNSRTPACLADRWKDGKGAESGPGFMGRWRF